MQTKFKLHAINEIANKMRALSINNQYHSARLESCKPNAHKKQINSMAKLTGLFIFMFLFPAAIWAQHVYHVAPATAANGIISGGTGTASNPWDLQTALLNASNTIQPGDVVLVHEGTYWGYRPSSNDSEIYVSNLIGTSSNPIIVKAAPCEHPVIDCTPNMMHGVTKRPNSYMMLRIIGAYTWFIGLEIKGSPTRREDNISYQEPLDLDGGDGIYIAGTSSTTNAQGNKIINCIIHDQIYQGVDIFPPASNTELNGNVINYNGWLYAPSNPDNIRPSGGGTYAQNADVCDLPSLLTFKDNFFFQNANDNFHLNVSEAYEKSNGIVADGNVSFNSSLFHQYPTNNFLQYGGYTQYNNVLKNNHFCTFSDENIFSGVQLGLGTHWVLNEIITNNHFVVIPNSHSVGVGLVGAGFGIANSLGTNITHNFMYGYNVDMGVSSYDQPNNRYYPLGALYSDSNTFVTAILKDGFRFTIFSTSKFCSRYNNSNPALYSWNLAGSNTGFYGTDRRSWQNEIHQDQHSTEILDVTSSGVTQMEIIKRKSDYDPGRANIIIYNWACSTSTSLNLSDLVAPGAPYRIRDVQNYYGTPVATGNYSSPITLPLNNTTVTQPVGLGLSSNPHMATIAHTNNTTYNSKANMFNTLILETVPYILNISETGDFCNYPTDPSSKMLLTIGYSNLSGIACDPPKSWWATRQWTKNGTAITGAIYDTVHVTDTGLYVFTLTYDNCLTLTKTVHITACSTVTELSMIYKGNNNGKGTIQQGTGIDNSSNTARDIELGKTESNSSIMPVNILEVNPNPTSGNTYIKYTVVKPGRVTIEMMDIAGNIVTKLVDNTLNAGTYTLELNANKLPKPGTYKIRMAENDDIIIKTLIRQ